MGLYIGASFLTLYELLATVLFHFITKTSKRQIMTGNGYWYSSYNIWRGPRNALNSFCYLLDILAKGLDSFSLDFEWKSLGVKWCNPFMEPLIWCFWYSNILKLLRQTFETMVFIINCIKEQACFYVFKQIISNGMTVGLNRFHFVLFSPKSIMVHFADYDVISVS